MQLHDASEIQKFVESHGGKEKFNPGLSRIKQFLEKEILEISERKIKVITIGGTNGKGETSHTLATILKINHQRFTLWTSPHIRDIRERFDSSESLIEISTLSTLVVAIVAEMELKKIQLSYYEILLAAFTRWTLSKSPSLMILEVGLGGRLDGVNIFDADIFALTSISRDHQEFLGNRFELILREKLGILRKGAVFISSLELKYLRLKSREYCSDYGVEPIELFESKIIDVNDDFSLRNQLMALSIWSNYSQQAIDRDFLLKMREKFQLINKSFLGRGEEIKLKNLTFVFWGSHNPDGLRKLIQKVKNESYNIQDCTLVWLVSFSDRKDDDLHAMMKMLKRYIEQTKNKIHFTSFEHPKAIDKDKMNILSKQYLGKDLINDWESIIDDLSEDRGANIKIFVTGSYYFVGKFQSFIQKFFELTTI